MFLSRARVPLPKVPPKVKQTGVKSSIATLEIGESGILMASASSVRSACNTLAAEFAEIGDRRWFTVFPVNPDGSAAETGSKFARVYRISEDDAREYAANSPKSVQGASFDSEGPSLKIA